MYRSDFMWFADNTCNYALYSVLTFLAACYCSQVQHFCICWGCSTSSHVRIKNLQLFTVEKRRSSVHACGARSGLSIKKKMGIMDSDSTQLLTKGYHTSLFRYLHRRKQEIAYRVRSKAYVRKWRWTHVLLASAALVEWKSSGDLALVMSKTIWNEKI